MGLGIRDQVAGPWAAFVPRFISSKVNDDMLIHKLPFTSASMDVSVNYFKSSRHKSKMIDIRARKLLSMENAPNKHSDEIFH